MASEGTVKVFNRFRGFGFITTQDGHDVFLHIQDCVDGQVPKQGDKVTFDMVDSTVKVGQQQAGNVRGGTDGAAADRMQGKMAVEGTGTLTGIIKNYNREKGFGFIDGPDGKDIFYFGSNFVDGSTPQQGDLVKYDVEPSRNKPEQMHAFNLTGGTGYPAPKGKGKGDAWAGDCWGPMKGDAYCSGGKCGPYGKGMMWGGDGWGWGGDACWGGKGKGWGGDMWGGEGWGCKGGGDTWGGKGKDAWGGKGKDAWGCKGCKGKGW